MSRKAVSISNGDSFLIPLGALDRDAMLWEFQSPTEIRSSFHGPSILGQYSTLFGLWIERLAVTGITRSIFEADPLLMIDRYSIVN